MFYLYLYGELLACLFVYVYGTLTDDSVRCWKSFHGSPSTADCSSILSAVASNSDHQPRYFDEEQLRSGPELHWPGVKNDFAIPVVQLPAYWSSGMFFLQVFMESCSSRPNLSIGKADR